MKQYISILFVFVIVLQSSLKLLIVADFKANQEYIAQTLCENRNQPELHCAGKCFLKKELRNEEKRQATVLKDLFEQCFYAEKFQFIFQSISFSPVTRVPFLVQGCSEYAAQLFRPPSIS